MVFSGEWVVFSGEWVVFSGGGCCLPSGDDSTDGEATPTRVSRNVPDNANNGSTTGDNGSTTGDNGSKTGGKKRVFRNDGAGNDKGSITRIEAERTAFQASTS